MKFNPEEVKLDTREDFDRAWSQSGKYLTPVDPAKDYSIKPGKGKPSPVYDTMNRLREAYLNMGFDEMVNPIIIDDTDIFKQFNYEALAVLDRVFYLGGLPRPNVGISDERFAQIEGIIGRPLTDADKETIRTILHKYKKGEIEGDDLVADLAGGLKAQDSKIAVVIDHVFPEFKKLEPEASHKTLRSHMTSGWFLTLEALVERRKTPVKLFSVDLVFRREQEENADRLRAYHSASCVIMDPDVNVEHGKAVAAGLLKQFGFSQFEFRPDDKRSKYYTPDTQIEVYGYHPALKGSNTKYRRTIWRCNEKYKGERRCTTRHITEDEIKKQFLVAINELLGNRVEVIANCQLAKDVLSDCSKIDAKINELRREIDVIAGQSRKLISENAHIALSQDEFNKRNSGYLERHRITMDRISELEGVKRERMNHVTVIDGFIRELQMRPLVIDELMNRCG